MSLINRVAADFAEEQEKTGRWIKSVRSAIDPTRVTTRAQLLNDLEVQIRLITEHVQADEAEREVLG